jgi:hypothetical protein
MVGSVAAHALASFILWNDKIDGSFCMVTVNVRTTNVDFCASILVERLFADSFLFYAIPNSDDVSLTLFELLPPPLILKSAEFKQLMLN